MSLDLERRLQEVLALRMELAKAKKSITMHNPLKAIAHFEEQDRLAAKEERKLREELANIPESSKGRTEVFET